MVRGRSSSASAAGCCPRRRCCPPALDLARDIAVNTAPMSVAASKRLLWDSYDLDRLAVGARETEIHLRLMGHDDAKAGVRAFLEGRAPSWTGKPVDPTAAD